MKQGIVVCTWKGGLHWAELCLDSLSPLEGMYDIYLAVNDYGSDITEQVSNPTWNYKINLLGIKGDYREIGAMKAVLDRTDLDEFWLFQDTVEITDPSFIVESFTSYAGISCSYMNNFMQFYLGKWGTDLLRKIDITLPKTKMQAIKYEHTLANAYGSIVPPPGYTIIDPHFVYWNERTNYIDTLFDEDRFAVVGKYLIKRVSLVRENFRVTGSSLDDPEYMSEEAILNFRKTFRRMINPSE